MPEALPIFEQLSEEEQKLYSSLSDYLDLYFKHIQVDAVVDENIESLKKRAFEILLRNNRMAELYASPEYEQSIVERLKELRGNCALGAVICVDGRVPIPQLFSRVVNVWESKAGILGRRDTPFSNIPTIESSRLVKAVESRAQNNDPLLEILFAHRSNDPNHSCGAMRVLVNVQDPEVMNKLNLIRMAKENGDIAPEYNDLVLANLMVQDNRAKDISRIYNSSINDPMKRLRRVGITAVYNTDNMTIEFGYGTEKFMSTVKFVRVLKPIIDDFARGKFASWKEKYTSIHKQTQLEFDSLQVDIMKDLMSGCHAFQELFDQLLQTQPDLAELTLQQQRALQLVVAKNIAFQYLTGICFEPFPIHPHHDHHEIAQSVNPDGINVGQFDPESQVFGASPATPGDAILHINVQTDIMNRNPKLSPPHIVYICKATTDDQSPSITERAAGHNRDFFLDICSDPSILERMRKGEIILIPVDIDDRTRKVRKVFLHQN